MFFEVCCSPLQACKSKLPQSKHESAIPVIQSRVDHRPQRSGARQTSGLGKVQVLHKGDRHPYYLEMDTGPGFPRKWVSQHLWFGVHPLMSFVQRCAVQTTSDHAINQTCRQSWNASITLTSKAIQPQPGQILRPGRSASARKKWAHSGLQTLTSFSFAI